MIMWVFSCQLLVCPMLCINGINVAVDSVSNELYRCPKKSRITDRLVEYSVNNLGKWERLLQDKDDGRVCRAKYSKGNFDMSVFGNGRSPSDEAFNEQ